MTDKKPENLKRRGFLLAAGVGSAGAGAAGALAVVAAALPKHEPAPPVQQAKLPEAEAGGYQLTEHVKRYYQTARV